MSGVADWNIVADMLLKYCLMLKRRLVVTCVCLCVEGAVLKDKTLYVRLGSTATPQRSGERFVTDQASSYQHTFVLTCYESGMLNSSVNSLTDQYSEQPKRRRSAFMQAQGPGPRPTAGAPARGDV